MIKRRFYKLEHGDGDAPSASSSSDSETEVAVDDASNPEKPEIEEEEEEEAKSNLVEFRNSSSSGYETEDSSANLDSSSGLPWSDDDAKEVKSSSIVAAAPPSPSYTEEDVKDCILKIKSVFKCRLCPKVLCLSEQTLEAHLNSKKHARAERLCLEGRLKVMLDADGKIVGQTPQPRNDDEEEEQIFAAKPKRKSSSGPLKEKKRSRQQEKKGKPMQRKRRRG